MTGTGSKTLILQLGGTTFATHATSAAGDWFVDGVVFNRSGEASQAYSIEMNLSGTLFLDTNTNGVINTASTNFAVQFLTTIATNGDTVSQFLFVIERFY